MTLNLPVIVERYLNGRCVSNGYANNLRAVARSCGTMSVDAINSYLKRRMDAIKPVTVATERAMLVGIWRWAYETGVVNEMPRGIVKIKPARKPTKAWTIEQCCTGVNGTFSLRAIVRRKKVQVGLFLRCWMLLGYETGARMGDLWEMRGDDIEDGAVRWSQHKTGDPHVKTLSPKCIEAVQQMLALSPDGRILGWVMSANAARVRMRKYLRSVGLSGTSKWLRRSGATHIEIEHPGKGRLHLGHRTVGLAEKSYIDWSQVRRDIPCTPVLLE
jgi:integrase